MLYKFKIFQKKAHYRIPRVLNDKLTYPLPTYSDVLTMLERLGVVAEKISISGLYSKKINDLKRFYSYTNKIDSQVAVSVVEGTFERFKFSEYLEDVYLIIHVESAQNLPVLLREKIICLSEQEAVLEEIRPVSVESKLAMIKYPAYIPDTSIDGIIFTLPRELIKANGVRRWKFVNVSYTIQTKEMMQMVDEDGDCVFLV